MAKRFSQVEPELKSLRAEKGTVMASIKKIRAEEDVIQKEMDKIKEDLAQTNAEKTETVAQLDALQEKIEKIEGDLSKLFAKKDELREAFWKGKYDFKKQREEIAHIEWMQRQKERVVQRNAQKKERDEELKTQIRQMDHYYQKELDCCDHLTGYLHSLKVRAGLIIDDEAEARKAQAQFQEEQVKEKLN